MHLYMRTMKSIHLYKSISKIYLDSEPVFDLNLTTKDFQILLSIHDPPRRNFSDIYVGQSLKQNKGQRFKHKLKCRISSKKGDKLHPWYDRCNISNDLSHHRHRIDALLYTGESKVKILGYVVPNTRGWFELDWCESISMSKSFALAVTVACSCTIPRDAFICRLVVAI